MKEGAGWGWGGGGGGGDASGQRAGTESDLVAVKSTEDKN